MKTARCLVVAALALALALPVASASYAKPKPPKRERAPDTRLQARAVCDSLAQMVRWRTGVSVTMREDRAPLCGSEAMCSGWMLSIEVADDASERALSSAQDLEVWLRGHGWQFVDSCFAAEGANRRAAFNRGSLGCSFDTAPLERAMPPAAGAFAPGYQLELGIRVRPVAY